MKKCAQCGASMKDDEMICPVCGREVQLVLDYETMESRIYEQKKQKEQEEERIRQEEQKRQEEKARRAGRRKKILTGVLIALLAAAAVVCLVFFIGGGRESFDSSMQKAETAYSNSNYQEALEYVEKALALDGGSAEALTLRAQIYDRMGDPEKAAQQLEQVIADNPNYEAAYGILIRIYSDIGHPEKIRELLDSCANSGIREKYSSYICDKPVFSLEAGTYEKEQTVRITAGAADAEIYYTTDGSEPTEKSQRYTKPLELGEGTTVLKAIAVNGQGIRSVTAEAEYTIHLSEGSLVISPASGSYTAETSGKITVTVPAGCTVYYSFDSRPDTGSTRYSGPVSMPDGTHTFYAIAVNSGGRITHSGSAVYVMNRSADAPVVTTPTPEATRTPSQSQIITTPDPQKPTEEPVQTPTVTPGEEPEPTGEPGEDPGSGGTEEPEENTEQETGD